MTTRRDLLRTMAFAGMAAKFAAAVQAFGAETRIPGAEKRAPLAFSTLGCPAWTWEQILTFAEQHGFAAVELRGLQGDLNLPARPEFSAERIAQSKKDVEAHGLKIACVSSSTELHHADAAVQAKQIADAKKFIDLAQGMGAPYVRVFGNKIEGPQEEVVARVAKGMGELAEYAGPRGVTVILESHGDFVRSPILKAVLTRANSPHAALLWDAHHTFVDGQEPPETTVAELGAWIRHTHLKDSAANAEGKDRKYVLTGRGDVPVKKQMAALAKIGYKGYYCFEWEKMWHPDLEAPEIAIADYAKVAGEYWREVQKA
jgi:sugar phosphate isomerase/epimerase